MPYEDNQFDAVWGANVIQYLTDEEPSTAMAVTDDGPGILAEDLDLLLERFYRGEAGPKSGEPGAGLVLSFCKVIMDL